MPVITCHVQGRFGNNLFQYFAAKILQHHLNDTYNTENIPKFEYKYTGNSRPGMMLSEYVFQPITEKLRSSIETRTQIASNIKQDIYVDGFFQFQSMIDNYRDFIQNLFTIENEDRINDDCCVKDIVKAIQNGTKPSEKDVVVHIRLEDFIGIPEVIAPKYVNDVITKVVQTLKDSKVILVVKSPTTDIERKYLQQIKHDEIKSQGFLEDFAFLVNSKNLILCRSTFGWIASVISKEKQNTWFPTPIPSIASKVHLCQNIKYIDKKTNLYPYDYFDPSTLNANDTHLEN